ncbi:MAG: DUF4998 domain-containing protein [Prevotellaceae bacterium]|nr:DUF4998 domain-containing protein [Prevotellaceae bacterium]
MKNIIKYFLPLCLLMCIMSCDDNNSLHQKYLDEGETLYAGKVEAILPMPGNERIKFEWALNSDPRIYKTVFFWNDGEDSEEVLINRSQSGFLIKEATFDIPEGIHTFEIINVDDEGHTSIPVEITAQIYGPTYISRLLNRTIKSSSLSGSTLTIDWASIESDLVQYTTVRYTDRTNPANPVARSLVVENSDTQTVIEGVEEEDVFSVSTAYLPEGGLDILDAVPVEYTIR